MDTRQAESWAAAGMVLLLAGSGLASGRETEVSGRASPAATVSVTNHSGLDVDIFAVLGSSRVRLGTVVASRTASFQIPSENLGAGSLRIAAEAVGTRDPYLSQALTVADGDRIIVTIGARLAQSSTRVESRSRH